MAQVSVNTMAVVRSIKLCDEVMESYRTTARKLENDCASAGMNWRDDKYRQYASVIDGCTNALNRPIHELEDCKQTLIRLLRAMEHYEQTSI